jgi:NAD(P)-dependent dehydrogenase (short-subunit alcohol dehydrogenase family)
MRMNGKIGIVTAAASGMGRAGALRFAREGASVAVVDIDSDGVHRVVKEITGAGGTAHGIVADLTKDEDSRRIVWDTVSRFKGLDFVWNHVGHPGPAAVEGIDLQAFDLAIDLNLRTVLITTEAATFRRSGRAAAAACSSPHPPPASSDRASVPFTRCASSASSDSSRASRSDSPKTGSG